VDFNLTTEQKIKALTASKETILSEMYLLLVRMGIDPDTFNVDDEVEENVKYAGEKYRLEGLIQSFKMVEGKLADLQ
jgi:hypothetical protein